MIFQKRTTKLIAGIVLTAALVGGVAYYTLAPRGPIVDFVYDRDAKEMLKLFYDDWYWLFPENEISTNYSPEYILKHKAPSKENYMPRYRGKLNIKVLRKDGKLAGFTTYYKKNFYEGWVQFVSVSPDFRRRGYGKMLTEYATQALFDMGMTRVVLNTRTNNPARRIYERIGFKAFSFDRDEFVLYEITKDRFNPKKKN